MDMKHRSDRRVHHSLATETSDCLAYFQRHHIASIAKN